MSGGYFDNRENLLKDWGNKLKSENHPSIRLLGQHLKELADVLYAIDMHLSGDDNLTDMQIIELVYSVVNTRTVQKFYNDEAEQLDKLAEGFHQLADKLK